MQSNQSITENERKHLKEKCLKLLRQYTKHDIVKITSSGDTAIFGALVIAKQHGVKTVFVPDQGGWLTYLTFPKILDLLIVQIKTTYGLIDPIILEKEAKKYPNCAFLFSSFAGYAAPQDLIAIGEVCKKYSIFLIEDVSGALTHPTLCNGKISDIIIGSFGEWKIVDVGYGGFLSCKKEVLTQKIKELSLLSLIQEKNMDYALLLDKLEGAQRRLQSILRKTKEIKSLCKKEKFEMIHEQAEGLSLFVKFSNDQEKERIIAFCNKHNIEYKECPMYIKVMEKALSLEIKRMNL